MRAVQRRTGHPTDEHLKTIVSQQSLKNNPIRSADVANAKSLFGPSVAGLKGWSTRKRTKGFPGERVSIPNDFYRLNKFVTIAADVMFIAGVPFFVTYSKKIKFLSVEYLPRRTARQLANALRKVLFIYARGFFLVRQAMMDMEFEKIKDLVPLVEVNSTAARAHVVLIEQTIRSAREKTRATTSEFPFMYIRSSC